MIALPSECILSMRGIRKRFGPTYALKGVDLRIARGSVHALIGENGAGKSTLMKILSGAYIPDEGEIYLDGNPYQPSNPSHSRALGVCMIYQELALAPHLSIMENILLGVEPGSGPFIAWSRTKLIAKEALDEVGLHDLDVNRPVETLSIAEQQLVEIARAVTARCKVLVLDEPTSSLTQRDVQRLFALVRRLVLKKVSVVYISHALEEVQELCSEFTVIRDGETIDSGLVSETPVSRIVAMMVGRDMEDLYPRSKRNTGLTVLRAENLAGEREPRDASLTLRRGEVLGIAGLMGAGRTELLRLIFGLDRIRSGTLCLGGREVCPRPGHNWSIGIGMVSEDRKNEGLAISLSLVDNLSLPKLTAFLNPTLLAKATEKWIQRLQIRCTSPEQEIGELSGGNQQKIAIARLLECDADVLLLDEPTRGIDVGSKAAIYHLINELACAGKAVLLVSSYLPELLGVCDRIAVMTRGILGPAKPVEEWDEHCLMMAATGQQTTFAN